jgi:sugar phosphate isomerase/epimerase
MPRLKIGVRLESLGKPFRAALEAAATLAVPGVQFDAVGDLAPDALTQTGRREVRNLLRTRNLEAAALGCPLRHGFDTPAQLEARVAYVKKVLSLAYELGARRVVVAAGVVPSQPADPALRLLRESLADLGAHGDRVGSVLALEAGGEPPAALAGLVRGLTSGGVGVNVDPANLLMRRIDPVAAVREFGGLIVHSHARDARPGRADRDAQEVPLGHGDVDWFNYFGALEEVGYQGWVTVKRGHSPDPLGDVKAGVAFLRRLLP